jgi:predicted ABC-type ATPase
MSQKRVRVFAGPNGSGKSTFIDSFPSSPKLRLGVYINADEIEVQLKKCQLLQFEKYKVVSSTDEFRLHLINSKFSVDKAGIQNLQEKFSVINNDLIVAEDLTINSYIAADIADYIRQKLLVAGVSFSFETVMSDSRKLEFLEKAKIAGYRLYLYYFSTEDPLINKSRVKLRVAQHGHSVDDALIEKRYFKSLSNLKEAVLLTDRAYIFDSSGSLAVLIAEINDGSRVNIVDVEKMPNWFIKYLVEK